MSTPFGQRLRAYRLALLVPSPRPARKRQRARPRRVPLSQNALARRAGIDPGEVCRMEHGTRSPRRATVLALAAALECDDVDTARLLVDAGYWPWPELSSDETEVILGVAFALMDCGPEEVPRHPSGPRDGRERRLDGGEARDPLDIRASMSTGAEV